MTIYEELLSKGYEDHHSARYQRYISRKKPEGVLEPYEGRFGKGYLLLQPAWDSTRYCYCTYMIRRDKNAN